MSTASKDKSKVHKLSLKGKPPNRAKWCRSSPGDRIGEAGGRIREYSSAMDVAHGRILTILSLNTLSTPSCKCASLPWECSSHAFDHQLPTWCLSPRRLYYVSPLLSHQALCFANLRPVSRNMGSTCWVRLFLRPPPSDTPLIDSVTADDQVKAYIKKIMSQLNKWMVGGKISKLVVVITSKETGEHVERWQFDVQIFGRHSKSKSSRSSGDKENAGPTFVLLHIYS